MHTNMFYTHLKEYEFTKLTQNFYPAKISAQYHTDCDTKIDVFLS